MTSATHCSTVVTACSIEFALRKRDGMPYLLIQHPGVIYDLRLLSGQGWKVVLTEDAESSLRVDFQFRPSKFKIAAISKKITRVLDRFNCIC